MGNDFTSKKRSGWWGFIKAILILAAIAFVAYKVYDKFFRKKIKQEVLTDDAAVADLPTAEAEAEAETPAESN